MNASLTGFHHSSPVLQRWIISHHLHRSSHIFLELHNARERNIAMSEDRPSQQPKRKRSVTFGSIQVREHERILGNTNTYMGLSIGWEYKEHGPISIPPSDYCFEQSRRCEDKTTASERLHILNQYGFSLQEVTCYERERKRLMEQAHCCGKGKLGGLCKLKRFTRRFLRPKVFTVQ